MVIFDKRQYEASLRTLKDTVSIDPSTIELRPQEGSLIYNVPKVKLDSELSPEELEYKELLNNPQNVLDKLEIEYCFKKIRMKPDSDELKSLGGKINQAIYYCNIIIDYSDTDSSCSSSDSYYGSSDFYHDYEQDFNDTAAFDIFADIENDNENKNDNQNHDNDDEGFTLVHRK